MVRSSWHAYWFTVEQDDSVDQILCQGILNHYFLLDAVQVLYFQNLFRASPGPALVASSPQPPTALWLTLPPEEARFSFESAETLVTTRTPHRKKNSAFHKLWSTPFYQVPKRCKNLIMCSWASVAPIATAYLQ